MFIVYNNFLIRDHDFRPGVENRALRFGDGLFETIRVKNSKPYLLEFHYERLLQGMKALHMEVPEQFSIDYFRDTVIRVINNNQHWDIARARIHVFRKSGGFYAPITNQVEWIVSSYNHPFPMVTKKPKLGMLNDYYLSPTPFSRFKTGSSLNYVMINLLKQQMQTDDVLVKDYRGMLAECSTANVFWVMGGQVFTSDIDTGCVEGVMRGYLIRKLNEKGFEVKVENMLADEVFAQAEAIFSCNSLGVHFFEYADERKLKTDGPLMTTIIQMLDI